jgi:hypothetical protein
MCAQASMSREMGGPLLQLCGLDLVRVSARLADGRTAVAALWAGSRARER